MVKALVVMALLDFLWLNSLNRGSCETTEDFIHVACNFKCSEAIKTQKTMFLEDVTVMVRQWFYIRYFQRVFEK